MGSIITKIHECSSCGCVMKKVLEAGGTITFQCRNCGHEETVEEPTDVYETISSRRLEETSLDTPFTEVLERPERGNTQQ